MKADRSRASSPSRSDTSSSWRVFCAVEVPDQVSRLTIEHIENLRRDFPAVPASWSREGKFHLTIKFLGNIQQDQVTALSVAASSAVKGISPFQISLAGAGTFPKHGVPRVLWIGIEDSSANLGKLQSRLEDECARLGFPREERSFHPHLTIVRLRGEKGARDLGKAHQELGFARAAITVNALLVFRSELSPKGSKYTLISNHPLGH
jgi:RNA 2',3'-cyclic 3'-phosphodiesterase